MRGSWYPPSKGLVVYLHGSRRMLTAEHGGLVFGLVIHISRCALVTGLSMGAILTTPSLIIKVVSRWQIRCGSANPAEGYRLK